MRQLGNGDYIDDYEPNKYGKISYIIGAIALVGVAVFYLMGSLSFWGWIVLIGTVLVALGIFAAIYSSEQRKKMDGAMTWGQSDFRPTWKYIGCDLATGIGIDSSTKKICLTTDRGSYVHRIIGHRDILEVQVLEDGHTVTKVSRASQAGSALVGGVLFGGVGAVVGALTGSSKTTGKINRIDLKITIRDAANPLFLVNFLHMPQDAGSSAHRAAMELANEWMGRLRVLMKAADDEDRARAPSPASSEQPTVSKADELSKLAKLKSDGILTDEEFQAEKRRLLA